MSLQAEKNAKSIVRELEDAKLAGIDYPVSSLINLRQVGAPCTHPGTSITCHHERPRPFHMAQDATFPCSTTLPVQLLLLTSLHIQSPCADPLCAALAEVGLASRGW